jgi:hypothetical protein
VKRVQYFSPVGTVETAATEDAASGGAPEIVPATVAAATIAANRRARDG